MHESKKPKPTSSLAEQELDKAEAQFQAFDENIQSLTLDRMNMAPKEETEPQTKLSGREIDKSIDIYLKPKRTYPSREKFNERFRDEYNFQRQYVHFTAEHNEIKGERIEFSLKCFPGTPIEDWVVPTNKPVWAPRMVAERISKCRHHRLVMEDNKRIGSDGLGHWFGQLAVDTTIQRLDARPVPTRRSIFMGESEFK